MLPSPCVPAGLFRLNFSVFPFYYFCGREMRMILAVAFYSLVLNLAFIAPSADARVSFFREGAPATAKRNQRSKLEFANDAAFTSDDGTELKDDTVFELKTWNLSSTLTRQGLQLPFTKLNADGSPRTHFEVQTPSTVFGGLVDAGYVTVDPVFGKNFSSFTNANYSDVLWRYETQFSLKNINPVLFAREHVLLDLRGVNYRVNITLNGNLVATDREVIGTFRRFTLDITKYVNYWPGTDNELVIDIAAPVDHTFPPDNNSTDLAMVFVDWNPPPPDRSMGLWRPVYIHTLRVKDEDDFPVPLTVEGLSVRTQDIQFSNQSLSGAIATTPTSFNVSVSFELFFWDQFMVDWAWLHIDLWPGVRLEHRLKDPRGADSGSAPIPDDSSASASTSSSSSSSIPYTPFPYHRRFTVSHVFTCDPNNASSCPAVWWPYQMVPGAQSLNPIAIYVQAKDKHGVISLHKIFQSTYGVRKSETRLDQWGSLQFYINNYPLQIRGGGWTPDVMLRDQPEKLLQELRMVRAMGLNAIRLEGKMESELFFTLTDQLGLVVLPGWCCCDAWQHWSYWQQEQYDIAAASMATQSKRLARHPSVIVFLYSSDELPPQNVEAMYLNVLQETHWPNPTINSAAAVFSNLTGSSGVKMTGPYSWVPPVYWLSDTNSSFMGGLGGAWGFLTEGGPGEAPMTLFSWERTVPEENLWNDLPGEGALDSWWTYHCGNPIGLFWNLRFYVPPLTARYGFANSARTFTYVAQASNYEGIRAMFEGYSVNKKTGATGVIQWMMNSAWPSNIWNLYDYYLTTGGGYYGAKKATSSFIHPVYNYADGSVWIINNQFLKDVQSVTVKVDLYLPNGVVVYSSTTGNLSVPADSSVQSSIVIPAMTSYSVYFARLEVEGTFQDPASGQRTTVGPFTNWYWLSNQMDQLSWGESNFYRTPCSQYANFTGLNQLPSLSSVLPRRSFDSSSIQVISRHRSDSASTSMESSSRCNIQYSFTNTNSFVLFFIRLFLTNTTSGEEVSQYPAVWDDNYFSLKPNETITGSVEVLTQVPFVEDSLKYRSAKQQHDCEEFSVSGESWNDVVSGNL